MKNKKIRKGSIVFLISFITLLAASLIFSLLYKDKFIQLVTSKVNDHLITEIKVNKIDFSLLKTFPFASVNFYNAQANSTTNFNKNHFQVNTDTLFYFERISFKFNPFDLIRKKYQVNHMEFIGGRVNLYADNKGQVNYIFWKKKPNKEKNNQLQLRLKNALLKNVNVVYINASKSFFMDVFSERGKIKGEFNNGYLTLKPDVDLSFNQLSVKNVNYNLNEKVYFTSTLNIRNKVVSVQNGLINTNRLEFQANGNIETANDTKINLEITGTNIDIVKFIEILPLSFKQKLKSYKSSGGLDISTKITGKISHRQQPHVSTEFKINNGKIQKAKTRAVLENVYLSGSFTNGEKHQLSSSVLQLNSIRASLNGNNLQGSLHLYNLLQPSFKTKIKGSVDLKQVHEFLQIESLKQASGIADTEIEISGSMNSPGRMEPEDAATWQFNGNISLINVAVAPKIGPFKYKDINGTVLLDQQHIQFNDFKIKAGDNDLLINGKFQNGIPYLIGAQTTGNIQADIQSDYLNLSSLAREQQNTKNISAGSDSSLIEFPDNLYVNGNFFVKQFIFKEFQAQNARGRLNYQPKTLILKSVYFDALEGSVSGGGAIAQRLNNDFTVRAQTRLKNINIHNLFSSFNHFGQNVLQAEHVNGTLNGFINFSADWNVHLKVYRPSIECESNVKINDGELIDFTPLLGLSKFIKVSELQHIQFSTLENEIKVENESVIIPQMDIKSSAFNIACSGIHNFDNTYDYKVQLLLSEVLSSKRDTRQKIVTEFGEIERDNLGRTKLYLAISGKGSNYHVKYDFKGTRKAIKEHVQEEKKEIKTILNKEFGWFKKDSLEQSSSKTKEKPKFIWEEEENDTLNTDPIK